MHWNASPLALERDACGIGFLAHLGGEASPEIVRDGLTLLARLEHRGACGCDGATGDGAGLLLQIPDAFVRSWAATAGVDLPAPGRYGVGTMFFPADASLRSACKRIVEAESRAQGLHLRAWRSVPTRPAILGPAAREAEPVIEQCIVTSDLEARDAPPSGPSTGDGSSIGDGFSSRYQRLNRQSLDPSLDPSFGHPLDRALYLVRRGSEDRIGQQVPDAADAFHIASLSAETLVYKGMLRAGQLHDYFPDLQDPSLASAFALVHARFSTNTLPRWSLAQPFRRLCHNGEINTLRGNINRLRAREQRFGEPGTGPEATGPATDRAFARAVRRFGAELDLSASDSCLLDGAAEMLHHAGRSLPHTLRMLVPPAWEHDDRLSPEERAFFRYHACLTEPWDGPAAIAFADGQCVGALLDRNGLRPARYTVTTDDRVVLASEAGVLDLDPGVVRTQGRLGPGEMIVADLAAGRLRTGRDVVADLARRTPYASWVDTHLRDGEALLEASPRASSDSGLEPAASDPTALRRLQRAYGYSKEDLRILLGPMADAGTPPVGSMGDDAPLAVLTDRPRLLYDHFRQLFAQVTNPPIDAIREAQVTSLSTYLGAEPSLLTETPLHARRLRLDAPILPTHEMRRLARMDADGFRAAVLDTTIPIEASFGPALDRLCRAATEAVADGATLLILSDRSTDARRLPVPALLAIGAVHQHLIRTGDRTRCSLIVDSFEPRETHHVCCLLGFGADAIHPRGAYATIQQLASDGRVDGTPDAASRRYTDALRKGILKVMSKMGISTLQSYQGAQIFEAAGLADSVVDAHFTHTPSMLGGIGLDVIERRARERHATGFQSAGEALDAGGRYQWRRGGEAHALSPTAIAKLQHATRSAEADDPEASRTRYRAFAHEVNRTGAEARELRGLLGLVDANGNACSLDEVEPWTDIVRRFKTGAMSYGSISDETHRTLAEAMNRLGGKSNTGEGGEHPDRYADDHPARSRIKQVASGRFGVTLPYLASADEIQIKIAQGAKPGEGGQLPGEKVYPWIAEVRHSTPGVPLISPPPHHDIYSIEDLAQLIFDLKNAAPEARVSVKLVSAAGVGTIAAGVAKARADHILISGHNGGTGASPQTSIMHAGMPWETGLADTHQMLVRQGLRRRVTLEADGGLRTGRDVAIAALLGAEEFGFSTVPLVSIGCIMMRKCHLNTCPVGIATQDPELREKFDGTPDQIVNYFYLVAQELREIMARLGVRTLEDMVGRTDRLRPLPEATARGLRLGPLLHRPTTPEVLRPHAEQTEQDHDLDDILDRDLIVRASSVLEASSRNDAVPLTLDVPVTNRDRTLGTMLSRRVVDRFGADGLPDGTLTLRCHGTAGQSFAAFGAPGITFDLEGAANDYVGKGLSGARVVIRPPDDAAYTAEASTVIGNVALYGATGGSLFVCGQAGERFAVRNSGAAAVVEGVGDHGCEYMTGGCVAVLGCTGSNFAAGMSGGVAYVLDPEATFASRCNPDGVELGPISPESDDAHRLHALISAHHAATQSPVAADLLDRWPMPLDAFVRVLPLAFKEAIEQGQATMPAPVPA